MLRPGFDLGDVGELEAEGGGEELDASAGVTALRSGEGFVDLGLGLSAFGMVADAEDAERVRGWE